MTLFSRLLVVGQQRSIDIADVFQFELSPIPPALIIEEGWQGRAHQVSQCLCHDSMCSKRGAGWCRSPSVPRRLASLRDYRRPGCKLRPSTGPLPSCLQENHSVRQIWPRCSQRKVPWADEKRKSQRSTSNPKHLHSMPRRSYSSQFQEQEST